jgi:hypothetical protein
VEDQQEHLEMVQQLQEFQVVEVHHKEIVLVKTVDKTKAVAEVEDKFQQVTFHKIVVMVDQDKLY